MASWLNRAKALWHRLFFWHTHKAASEEIQPEAGPDHALVLSVHESTYVTGWRKLLFLHHVLDVKEKRLFWSSIGAAFVLFVLSGWLFIQPHLTHVPTEGGELTEALVGAPKSINPLYAPLNDVDRDLTSLIYSGLFRLNEHLDPEPDLVDRYTWSQGGTVLELTLRSDIRFQDNTPVTADDVVFTYQAIKSPTWRSPLATSFKDVSVVRVDDQTVQFIIDKPNPQLLSELTVGILPAHLWQDVPNPMLADLNLRPVGSGPYQISSRRRDQKGTLLSYSLSRSNIYYGIKPYLFTRTFNFFTDLDQAEQALKSHQVDSLAFVPWNNVSDFAHNAVHAVALRLPQETVAFFNLRDGLLKDQTLRGLLQQSIDQDGLADAIKPAALPNGSPFPFIDLPAATSSNATSSAASLDVLRGAFETAGWKLDATTGLRSFHTPLASAVTHKNGKKITTVTSSTATLLQLQIDVPDQPDLVRIANYLSQRWSLVGAKVTVQAHPAEELFRSVLNDHASYQILVWNILLQPTQDPSPFWSSTAAVEQGLNFSNVSDHVVDQRLADIHDASSTDALAIARIAFAKALISDVPAIFLARPSYAYLVNDQVQGVTDMNLALPSDRLNRSATWSLQSALRWR